MHNLTILTVLGLFFYQRGWLSWRPYHTTMLYILSVDLLHLYMFHHHHMFWVFKSNFIPHSILVLIYALLVMPVIAFLYLKNMPNLIFPKIRYILLWILGGFTWELILHLTKNMSYDHGWSLGWSFLFYFVMFPMLYLHHKKPVQAYLLSVSIITLFMLKFNVSIK